MNVRQARVQIRERAPTEVLDLALVLIKRNARAFAMLSAVLVIPTTAIVWALVESATPAPIYALFVGSSIAATAIRAPVVLLCGHAMFAERVPLGWVWSDTRRHLPAIAKLVVRRALLSLTIVGIVWDWVTRYHVDEVLLLERLEGEAVATRLTHLRRRFGGSCQEQLVHHAFLGAAAVVCASSVWVLVRLVFESEPMVWWPISGGVAPFVAAILLTQVYLATAKFLFYLNLRTVNEGWDLFLETRAIESMLAPQHMRASTPRLTDEPPADTPAMHPSSAQAAIDAGGPLP